LTQIPPEHADELAMTTTGEIVQLVRLHYEVLDMDQLRDTFARLRCMEYDASQRRWVWLYTGEAMGLVFKGSRVADDVILGEFVFKGTEDGMLTLRSIERAIHAILFFDEHVLRTTARVAGVTISNRLLSTAEAASIGSLDRYFDHAHVVAKEPESLGQDLKSFAADIPDERERSATVMHYMDDKAKQPVPAIERFPLHYDGEGIRSLEARFAPHQVIAMRHWRGETDYTRYDMMRDIIRHSEIAISVTDTMPMTEASVEPPLTEQLSSLMDSESYEDWLQAWELLRDNLPDSITTFDALDAMWDLEAEECSVNDMLYELDEALANIGSEDLYLLAKRVEVSRWVYTHFPEETELNLGNFRGHEAEALWELGQRDQAETLYQELIEVFPNFAWGYIWWGDQYWMSDWSYEYAPDYDRAESLYRRALANPNLDNRVYVQERLDDLYDEKEHPERREQIKQTRLKYIQRRKNLE
jgi:hypothetical protein